ncbi:hypothetical protein BUALT_Bualt01G0143500 [Buddleja alternifolia]|uniref:non-specific serine/threonine protein kinase n=1 Tax=Buddleja alternifolia TaxID=168488 RepID=A0AAV6YB80_9LAMI|nr:hypothetical protein BUALT_Bualt01G0143500 [Buddleja alternifolia]
MKHIFKKLHHQPNRSNETPLPPQSQSQLQSPSPPPFSSSPSAAASSATSSVSRNNNNNNNSESNHLQHQQQDYFLSEEEYQVQLALALSVSSSSPSSSSQQDSALVDPDDASIRTGGGLTHTVSADSLSRRYWNYGVLDFEERVVDGFYDAYNLSADAAVRAHMPSLADLESNNGASDYEVIIINRKLDPALEELMQIAHCIVLDCNTIEIALLVQRLAELVTEHLGGAVRDANLIFAKWMERSMELRTSLHTTVLPIGSLRFGLLRHRALLFKALADSVGIPCRLVKGSHYTGVEDDAVNIIKLQDGSECLVDLMGAPGTLIPADVLSMKDSPLNSYNSEQHNLQSLQTTKDANVSSANCGQNSLGAGCNTSLGATSWKPESLLSSANASADGVGTSGLHDIVPSANQLDHSLSKGIGSSFYKGNRGPSDGARINLNVIPYSQRTAEDPKNLFADLNPFQIKGSDKSLVQNDLRNEVDKLQLPENNNFSSRRPPAPLIWKNRLAWNEVSKKNEYDFVEGLFVKNEQGANNVNVSPVASISSMDQSRASIKLSEKSFLKYTEKSDRPSGDNFKLASAETEQSQLSEFIISDKGKHLGEDKNIMHNKEGQMNNTRLHDRKEDGIIGRHIKLMETKGACCLPDTGANCVDTVIDDVGDCEILWEDLVIGERIGLGSYGEVYHADWNGTEVAVKKFLDQDFSGAALDEFKREVRIMRRLRHPNVVLFMGAVTRAPNLSIVTEFLPRGSLYRIIHRPHCQIDEKRRIKMALDVAKGMNCLHTSIPTIVHRDLKSPNLLVDNNWNVKVGDFGLSRLKHNTFLSSKSTAGTPEWMAPEVLRNEPSNEKCDVYSFGVILWELATLKLPWSGMNPMQVVGAVGFQNRRLDIPKQVDPLVARIIWECWQMDPNLRPSFAQLTVALKSLQRLIIPPNVEQQT